MTRYLGSRSKLGRERLRGLTAFAILAAAAILTSACGGSSSSNASSNQVIVIGDVEPLSGAYARDGQLSELGAQMAVDEINKAGGISALNGAKLKLVATDAGTSPELAGSAADRLIAQNPTMAGMLGSWLSSYTLVVAAEAEKAHIPLLTLSYADSVTGQGGHYIFQTSPTSSEVAAATLSVLLDTAQASTGKRPTTVGAVSDNTAGPAAFMKALRGGGFAAAGLKVVMDYTFTPPLSDATSIVQQIKTSKPDFIFTDMASLPDNVLVLQKLKEFGLSVPFTAQSAALGLPSIKQSVDPTVLEGLISIVGNWPGKPQANLIEAFDKRTGEPWMTQDSQLGYANVWILKDAMESAKSSDPVKIANTLHSIVITSGPGSTALSTTPVQFDAAGRLVNPTIPAFQWQNGVPVVVFPSNLAVAKPFWPTSG